MDEQDIINGEIDAKAKISFYDFVKGYDAIKPELIYKVINNTHIKQLKLSPFIRELDGEMIGIQVESYIADSKYQQSTGTKALLSLRTYAKKMKSYGIPTVNIIVGPVKEKLTDFIYKCFPEHNLYRIDGATFHYLLERETPELVANRLRSELDIISTNIKYRGMTLDKDDLFNIMILKTLGTDEIYWKDTILYQTDITRILESVKGNIHNSYRFSQDKRIKIINILNSNLSDSEKLVKLKEL